MNNYQSNGYHPLVCHDGLTGDLIKIRLRDGIQYSCAGVVDFLQTDRFFRREMRRATIRPLIYVPTVNDEFRQLSGFTVQ